MKIFWSWQSDHKPAISREFVKSALQEALAIIAADLSLTDADRPNVDHDTQGEPGLVDIVATIFNKISECSSFVADVTPVGKSGRGSLMPNPNVMIELGYALGKIGPDRIVLVANKAYDHAPEQLPFDLRGKRGPITYSLAEDAKGDKIDKERARLAKALAEALSANLAAALAKRDGGTQFVRLDASSADVATWLEPGQAVEHSDFFNSGGASSSWKVTPGPYAYLRVCPAGWINKPTRHQVQNASQDIRLQAFGRYTNGDGGANPAGVVAVGLYPHEPGTVHAVAQWFDKTGEYWGFNSRVTGELAGRQALSTLVVIEGWARALSRAVRLMRHFKATEPFYVEAGITGLAGTYWHDGKLPALDPVVRLERRGRDWSRAGQIGFVTDISHELWKAFNLPESSVPKIEDLWPQWGLDA